MKTWVTLISKVLLCMALCVTFAESAFANGYRILCVKDAKATSMGEAFVAQADNPSAIAFNPAGLAQLSGNQVNLQATVVNGFTEHTSPSGVRSHNDDTWQAVPSFFATTDMGRKGVAAGIGVTLPNGLSSKWADDSFARYVTTYSDLIVADISPALGIRVTDRLMVGASVSFYYSEADLRAMTDLGLLNGAPGAMDTERRLTGNGTSWGGSMGAIYRISERHSVGATFRLPFTIDYEGDFDLGGLSSSERTSVDFPATAVVGYAFRPVERCKIEADLDWTDWHSVRDTVINTDMPGFEQVVYSWQLKSTLAYKLGLEYACSDKLDLRCGYIYNPNATPDATWRPSLPDTDTHFITAGCGYDMGNTTIDLALLLIYYDTRSIDNNVDMNETISSSSIDGAYRSWAPCASVAATYHF